MQELFYQIQKTNEAYGKFINQWNSYGNNTGTGTQFSAHYATLRPTQNELVNMARNLIEGKLDFIENFSSLLVKIKSMQKQLENQIQSKRIYAHNTGTGKQFAAYISNILKIGQEVQKNAKFLLENWDIQFIQQLYQKGLTGQAIQILIKQNIKRNMIPYLTDADIAELGINKLGDKIILKKIIKGN